jgi:hypothetical protein
MSLMISALVSGRDVDQVKRDLRMKQLTKEFVGEMQVRHPSQWTSLSNLALGLTLV